MNLIFFCHPDFMNSESMPRFAKMLTDGMMAKGHSVQQWKPKPIFYRIPAHSFFKKWLGYIDQFLVFPFQVRLRLKKNSNNTLFVFTDNALGPWVPLVAHYPHVMHCHDFLAQQSALDRIPENKTSRSGKLYQSYIFKGYSKAKNFISVSQKTQQDLHDLLQTKPRTSEIIYNGMNRSFLKTSTTEARREMSAKFGLDLSRGYLFHVGGNQWYKNRKSLITLYNAWRKATSNCLPLLLIGERPDKQLLQLINESPFVSDIHVLTGIEDNWIQKAYSGGTIFLFPSIAEGFGWPIAEAMICGCPVITANEQPMIEVGGDAAFYIPKYPKNKQEINDWALVGAELIEKIVQFSEYERTKAIEKGIQNCERFNRTIAIDKIEEVYKRLIDIH